MQYLSQLEHETIFILREAFARVKPTAMLWSIGKDSTALLWIIRKAFLGHVPFPMVQLDTEMELPEVYEFRDRIASEWSLDLRIELCPPESDMDPTLPPASRAAARKTAGLRKLIDRERFKGIILGIRRDEQSMRAKERVFCPRSAADLGLPQSARRVLGSLHHGHSGGPHCASSFAPLDRGRHLAIHVREHIPFCRCIFRVGITLSLPR